MKKNITTDTHVFFLTSEFSQWYPSIFRDEHGREFNCAEQWMMFKKAELFGDKNAMAQILRAKDPSQMKNLGRKVAGFDPAIWEASCQEIVAKGNVLKFSQNPDLWEVLDRTDSRMIVEAASYDAIWGIGLGAEAALESNPATWGKNYLGLALMKTRSFLRSRPDLVSSVEEGDRKVFSFYDYISQRDIRFSVNELARSLSARPDELPQTLARMGAQTVAMDIPCFLKAPVKKAASALLAHLAPAPSKAAARPF